MIGGLQQMAQQLMGHADQGTYDQIPHEQAYGAYRDLQQQMSPDQFSRAAQDYYQQATPEQRAQLAQQFQQGLQQTGAPQAQQWSQMDPNQVTPQQFGQLHQQVQQQNPDFLHQIFSPGGALGSTGSKLAVAGIAAFAAKHFLG